MLFEIAHMDSRGELHRGGIAATIRTVGKWIEESLKVDPGTIYVAVPADDDAITISEHNRRMRGRDCP